MSPIFLLHLEDLIKNADAEEISDIKATDEE